MEKAGGLNFKLDKEEKYFNICIVIVEGGSPDNA